MIDSHCHLDFQAFDDDRGGAIEEARRAGVDTIVNIGVDVSSSERSVALARDHEGVYAAVGVHPHDARLVTDAAMQRLDELARRDKVVAIGEIGLDFYRDLSPRSTQRRAFRRQLDLAVKLHLPVVIHTRESFNETVKIVREYAGDLSGGVFHCFPGTVDDAHAVIDLGFVISVGGVITFPKAKMASVAAAIPLDKIILETDAPYLTPVPHRGKQNRPAYVRYVYAKLAELKGISVVEVEKTVDRAGKKLFGLVDVFGG